MKPWPKGAKPDTSVALGELPAVSPPSSFPARHHAMTPTSVRLLIGLLAIVVAALRLHGEKTRLLCPAGAWGRC